MIFPLDAAHVEGRALHVQSAVRAGFPAAPMFVLPVEELYRHAGGPGGRHEPIGTADSAGGPADVEQDLEAALEEEWSVLSAPLGRDAETQITRALNQYDTSFMLVRSESGDALGTRLARGRFGALQAIQEVRASARFNQVMGQDDRYVIVSAILGDPSDLRIETQSSAGAVAPWVSRLDADWAVKSSLWLVAGEGPRMIDAGGPPIDLSDCWGLTPILRKAGTPAKRSPERFIRSDMRTVLEARVLLGRVFNRVTRPPGPYEWIPLLLESSSGSDPERAFVSACAAVQPGSGERLIALARWSVEMEHDQASAAAEVRPSLPMTPTDRKVRPPIVQQLIGRGGTSGTAGGPVRHVGTTARPDGCVLVCERLVFSDAGSVRGAVAIVERKGSRFGTGSLIARQRGIPHVCGVTDAALLTEGSAVIVNADLGVVTRKGPG